MGFLERWNGVDGMVFFRLILSVDLEVVEKWWKRVFLGD